MALTVPHDLKIILDDLAEAMEKPTSKVVVELLQELSPQLRDTATMIRLAKAGNTAGVKKVLAHMVGDQAANLLAASIPDPKTQKGGKS